MAKKQKVTVVGSVLRIEYAPINKVFERDLRQLPESVYKPCDAADHGIMQKFGDAKSGESSLDKWEEVHEIWDSLKAGAWKRTGERDPLPIILEAIAKIKRVPLKKVQEAAEVDRAQFLEAGKSKKVKAVIAQIRADRLKAEAEEEDDLQIDLK